jgi:hypothetical protein
MGKDIYIFLDQDKTPYSYDFVIDKESGKKMAEDQGHEYCGIFNTKNKPLILGKDYEFKFNRSYTSKIAYRELSCPMFLPLDYSNSFGAQSSSFKFKISTPSKFGINVDISVVLENGLSNQLWGKDNKTKFRIIEKNNTFLLEILDKNNQPTNKAAPLKIIGS